MRECIDRFAAVMDEVLALHEELLAKADEKRKAVTDRQISALDALVREEQVLLARQAELEYRRAACVREICEKTGQAPENTTLLTIAALGGAAQGERLRTCAETLKQVLSRLRQANDINSRLIENQLEYIDCMVETRRTMNQPTSAYSSSGADLRARDSSKLYDKKV